MLILSENGMALYDTRSGTAITVVEGTVQGVWIIQGAGEINLKTCCSKDEAISLLYEVWCAGVDGNNVSLWR